ncbi:MAG: PHP domain-containing protein [Deltaproteobacteria bacterium]|nr:MAG: PHP domain-containing protein [Deltaproteobacteria bacterium]
MIDLHTHSLLSDGELLPEELLRRYEAKGYRFLAITDHAGPSNLEGVLQRLLQFVREVGPHASLRVVPGVELTHCPPSLIPGLIERARRLGAKLVVVHGETLVEPVSPGTNRVAIEHGADILAHPGLITEEEAALAAERGVSLELSSRRGHCLANGHVARMAKKVGAKLVISSDAHSPEDILDPEEVVKVGLGAGLGREEVEEVLRHMEELASRCLR